MGRCENFLFEVHFSSMSFPRNWSSLLFTFSATPCWMYIEVCRSTIAPEWNQWKAWSGNTWRRRRAAPQPALAVSWAIITISHNTYFTQTNTISHRWVVTASSDNRTYWKDNPKRGCPSLRISHGNDFVEYRSTRGMPLTKKSARHYPATKTSFCCWFIVRNWKEGS